MPINCIVRELSPSFTNSIKQNIPKESIIIELAYKQHNEYTKLMKKLCVHVDIINGDEYFLDCCFIEDAIISIGGHFSLCNSGAESRRNETIEVEKFIKQKYSKKKNIIQIKSPGYLDGGDVLFISESKRTNIEAIIQLQNIFINKYNVYHILIESLHLKSVVSHLNHKF